MRDLILQAANAVYNQLGYGLSESCYRRALTAELKSTADVHSVQEEYGIPLYYRTISGERCQITVLRADILLTYQNRLIVLELKTLSKELSVLSKEYSQVNRYAELLIADEKYLINFGRDSIQLI